jgi:hypothetical protein
MPQYDAGPGDWSDRPWEDPEKKPQAHARRRRFTLPPWALLAILIAIAIILCVSLVLAIRAIRNREGTPTPTAEPTSAIVIPTATVRLDSTTVQAPTPTVVLPIEGTGEAEPPTEIGLGVTVVVKGTGGAGLNLREQPTTYGKILASSKEGSELTVIDGPKEADGYTWWKLRMPSGEEGWGAANWLVLPGE